MSVMSGHYQDAENSLLQAGLVFRAILLNIFLHQWDKALDLSMKHQSHVDTVVGKKCDNSDLNFFFLL